MAGTAVRLAAGDVAQFDTYFNAFGVGKWLRHTTVRNLAVAVETHGHVRLEVVHDQVDRQPFVVAADEFCTTAPTEHELGLPPLDELGGGSMFVRVTCLDGFAGVHGGEWRTTDPPVRDARLGVVITTFNRPLHVRANIDHLVRAFGEVPELADRIDVVVVDNGRNLDLGTVAGSRITVLPNPNTGGAGGFARGLMHFRSSGDVSHVLFMDDDVNFDPEIVFRTLQVLTFATSSNLCVAGAMLDRDTPNELFEAGARYLGTSLNPNRAIGQGTNVEDWRNLLVAECERDPIDYGAWWFFAFGIGLTRDNPVPTFLRGDDVLWGLLHAGADTVTFNGIGLWHDGFERKNGPLAWFYETRNFALANVLAVPGYHWWHLFFRYLNLCARSLFSLKYASAANITFGMQEFLRGPEHWLALDQAELNERVAAFDGEHVERLTSELVKVDEMPVRRGLRRYTAALGSLALLGGHALPDSLDHKPLRAVPIQQRVLGASPGHGAILYRDGTGGYGFVAQRDRPRFFRLFADMVRTAAHIPRSFGALRRSYRAAYPEMVSDTYWQRQFGLEVTPTGSTSSPARPEAHDRPTRRPA